MPAYTSHGWQIPRSVENHPQPVRNLTCGGPGFCKQCTDEVARWVVPSEQDRAEQIDTTLEKIGYTLNNEVVQAPYDPGTLDMVRHDENTLFKVLTALGNSGLTEREAHNALLSMQNAGILFRERI